MGHSSIGRLILLVWIPAFLFSFLPQIGKSLFLHVLLCLILHAWVAVIFQDYNNHSVFSPGKVVTSGPFPRLLPSSWRMQLLGHVFGPWQTQMHCCWLLTLSSTSLTHYLYSLSILHPLGKGEFFGRQRWLHFISYSKSGAWETWSQHMYTLTIFCHLTWLPCCCQFVIARIITFRGSHCSALQPIFEMYAAWLIGGSYEE